MWMNTVTWFHPSVPLWAKVLMVLHINHWLVTCCLGFFLSITNQSQFPCFWVFSCKAYCVLQKDRELYFGLKEFFFFTKLLKPKISRKLLLISNRPDFSFRSISEQHLIYKGVLELDCYRLAAWVQKLMYSHKNWERLCWR